MSSLDVGHQASAGGVGMDDHAAHTGSRTFLMDFLKTIIYLFSGRNPQTDTYFGGGVDARTEAQKRIEYQSRVRLRKMVHDRTHRKAS